MLDFDIVIICILFVVYLVTAAFLKFKSAKSNAYLVIYTFFFIYLSGVLKYTQFPIMLMNGNTLEQNVGSFINYVPLLNLDRGDIQTSVLNIILAMPFGILLPMMKRKSLKQMLAHGVLFGFLIELIQLLVALIVGFTLRTIDINDIIFNFIGVMAGYVIYHIFIHILKKLANKFSLPMDFLIRHLLQEK